jgi:hypothetical protein
MEGQKQKILAMSLDVPRSAASGASEKNHFYQLQLVIVLSNDSSFALFYPDRGCRLLITRDRIFSPLTRKDVTHF